MKSGSNCTVLSKNSKILPKTQKKKEKKKKSKRWSRIIPFHNKHCMYGQKIFSLVKKRNIELIIGFFFTCFVGGYSLLCFAALWISPTCNNCPKVSMFLPSSDPMPTRFSFVFILLVLGFFFFFPNLDGFVFMYGPTRVYKH